jgi:hypothetical protein
MSDDPTLSKELLVKTKAKLAGLPPGRERSACPGEETPHAHRRTARLKQRFSPGLGPYRHSAAAIRLCVPRPETNGQ